MPESVTTGFPPQGVRPFWDVVDTMPGKFTDEATRWTKDLGIYVVFPTYECGGREVVVYNSAALIGPEGVLGVYRKIYLFPSNEEIVRRRLDYFWQGTVLR